VTAGSKEARARSSGFKACVNGDLDWHSSSCGITVRATRKRPVTRWWDAQETAVSGSAPAPRVDDRASGRKHEAVSAERQSTEEKALFDERFFGPGKRRSSWGDVEAV
jgi:hypothetical protein